jgi:hypothetical protein
MEEEYDLTQSKYNEAMLQIQRLHFAWVNSNNYARNGEFQKWRWELDVIWRELFSDIKKLHKDKTEKILERFSELGAVDVYDLNERIKIKIDNTKGKEFYSWLDKRHLFLKELQDMVGKGSVFQDASDEGM